MAGAEPVDAQVPEVRDQVEADVAFVGAQGAFLDVLASGEPVGEVYGHGREFGGGDVQVQGPPDLVGRGHGRAGLDGDLDEVPGLDHDVRIAGVGDGQGGADTVQDGVGVGLGRVGAVA